jgi:S1-C subfamily serine protease
MKRINILCLLAITLLSSCASILNGKYQKVEIIKSPDTQLIIDQDTIPHSSDNKYKLRRDGLAKQIILKKEGYKNDYNSTLQYKKSPLYIMSVIPFGVILYPMFYDIGPKAYNYKKVLADFEDDMIKELNKKEEAHKYISINEVKIEIKKSDVFFSTELYKNYLKDKKIDYNVYDGKDIKITNTIFDKTLNRLLKDKGYIDTTNKIIKDNFSNKLYINLLIDSISWNTVRSKKLGVSGSFYYVNLSTTWEILDYYKKTVYTVSFQTKSGEFVTGNETESPVAFSDALEFGLINFFKDSEVLKHLTDKSDITKELSFEKLYLPTSTNFVSNIPQSVKASITVKNDKGHGSGFFISNKGHIITNYNVITDTTNSKIILNNEKSFNYKILRISKINDLALIKIDYDNEYAFKIKKDAIEIGEEIYAVGTPSGEDLSQSISKGIISGIRKKDANSKLIQTDASINPGNSGGAIILKNGEVVGVVSSKLFGFGIEGVAFGIPAYDIYKKLMIDFK